MDKHIPNYSPKAISEALEAAVLRAAFLELEEAEMKNVYNQIKRAESIRPERADFARKLRSRIARRRFRAALSYGLPRAMQAAACLIGVLALGAGVALAASSAAREWAAGVLTTGAENYVSDNQFDENEPHFYFYAGDKPAGGYDSGAVLDETLWLLGNSNTENVLYAQTSTEAQPETFPLKNAQNQSLYNITAGEGELYGLYNIMEDETQSSRFGVARICLGEDGYTLETIGEWDCTQLTPPEGCEPKSLYAMDLLWGGGRLYMTCRWELAEEGSGWNSGWGNGAVELFCLDPASGSLTTITLPDLNWGVECVMELFAGPQGTPCLAMTSTEQDAVGVWAIQADGTLIPVTEIDDDESSSACCFACSAEGTLYYLQNGVIYAAPGMDAAAAQRMAAVASSWDQGAALGAHGYVLINELEARIFNLESAPEIGELRVVGSLNGPAQALFVEKNPDVAISQSSEFVDYSGDMVAALQAGALKSDIYILDGYEVRSFLDAGVCTPLTDDRLLEAVSRMNEGVQDFVTRDGQVVAFPVKGYVYSEVYFDQEAMEVLGMTQADLPQTWGELLDMLAELSRSESAQLCPLSDQAGGAATFAGELMYNMATQYENLCAEQGQTLDFSDPKFAQLVERFAQIDFNAFRYGEIREVDGSIEVPQENSLLSISGSIFDAGLSRDSLCNMVSLKFADDDPLYTRASGFFAVIHPYSLKKDLAQQYLQCVLDVASDGSELLNLYAQADLEELERPISQEDFEFYQEKVGRLYFPGRGNRLYMQLNEALNQYCAAWLSGAAQPEEVFGILDDFYTNPAFEITAE